ncbi:hypothetical protein RI367_005493 [Sorochytrium milnesiophthora]
MGNGALSKYEARQNDCYKAAATSLRQGCQDLALGEQDKIRYAVRLTLCEIATASMVSPLECTDASESEAACVQAFGRTPQLWTSYSGYFREVVSMCYAVRYQVERELLEALYYNLTYQQLLNNKLLTQHAEDVSAFRQVELGFFRNLTDRQDALVRRAQSLENSTVAMSVTVLNVSDTVAELFEAVGVLHGEYQHAAAAVAHLRAETERWHEHAREQAGLVNQALAQMETSTRDMSAEMSTWTVSQQAMAVTVRDLERAMAAMQASAVQHSQSILNALAGIDSAVQASQTALAAASAQQSQALAQLKDQTDALMLHQLGKFSQVLAGLDQLNASTLVALLATHNMSAALATFHGQEMERWMQVNRTVEALYGNLTSWGTAVSGWPARQVSSLLAGEYTVGAASMVCAVAVLALSQWKSLAVVCVAVSVVYMSPVASAGVCLACLAAWYTLRRRRMLQRQRAAERAVDRPPIPLVRFFGTQPRQQ